MELQKTRNYLLILFSIIILGFLIYFLVPVSLPIIFAFVTSLFLAPTVTLLMRKAKIKRAFSVFFIFILFLLLLLLTSYFLLTKAITQLNIFLTNLPNTINELTIAWNTFLNNFTLWLGEYSPDLVAEIDRAVIGTLFNLRESLTNIDLIGYAAGAVIKIPSYVISLLVYFIVLYLFLLELPKLRHFIFQFAAENTAEKVKTLTTRLYDSIVGFFKAQLLIGIITFILIFIAMQILQPEMAFILTLIIWIIDFIPIIGSMIILIPWAAIHIMIGNIPLAVQLIVLAFVLLAIRRIIEPRIMGKHIAPSSLVTLISIYLGWKLLGIIGLFLGPIIVILYTGAKEAGFIKANFKT